MNLLDSAKEPSFVHHRKDASVLIHIVNMRRRIKPPLPEATVGNIIWRTCSYYEPSNTDTKLEDLEHTLRQSLSKIDTEFVGKIIGDGGFETVMRSLQQLHENYRKGSETYVFTSWRNMGMKEVDFGWGKAAWIGTGGKALESGVKNFVILMETVRGDGIEAWIVLEDEAMKLLELDVEFLEFASLNPAIILA